MPITIVMQPIATASGFQLKMKRSDPRSSLHVVGPVTYGYFEQDSLHRLAREFGGKVTELYTEGVSMVSTIHSSP